MKIISRPVLNLFAHSLVYCLVSQTIFINGLYANGGAVAVGNPVNLEQLVSTINTHSFNGVSVSDEEFLSQVDQVQRGMAYLLDSVEQADMRLKAAGAALQQASPANRSVFEQALAKAMSDYQNLKQISTSATEISNFIYGASGLLLSAPKDEFDYPTFLPRNFSDDELSSKNAATAAKSRYEKARQLEKLLRGGVVTNGTSLIQEEIENKITRAAADREAARLEYAEKSRIAGEAKRRSVSAERVYNKARSLRKAAESGTSGVRNFTRTVLRDILLHRLSLGFGIAPVPPFSAVLYLAQSEGIGRYADKITELRFKQLKVNQEYTDVQKAEANLRTATSEADRLVAENALSNFNKRLNFQRSKRNLIREDLKFFSINSGVFKNQNGTYSISPTTTIGELGFTVGSAFAFIKREHSKIGEPTIHEANIASGMATLAYASIERLVLDNINLYIELESAYAPQIAAARTQRAELTAERIERILNPTARVIFAFRKLEKLQSIE